MAEDYEGKTGYQRVICKTYSLKQSLTLKKSFNQEPIFDQNLRALLVQWLARCLWITKKPYYLILKDSKIFSDPRFRNKICP